MDQHQGQNLNPGDVVGLSRHGGEYRATVVGTGPVNARVRYTCNNGKQKTVSERYAHLRLIERKPEPTQLTPDQIEEARSAEERKPRQGHELLANATQERAAADLYQTDWDENGTRTVHLPKDVAAALLESCGYYREPAPKHRWVSPSGRQYWDTEEALTQALTAITMGGAR